MNRKRLLGVILLAGMLLAAAAVYELVVPKSGWIDGFKSGSSELNSQQIAKIHEISEILKQHPEQKIVLKGSVSSEVIKGGVCCTSVDGKDFSLGACAGEGVTINGEQESEIALGFSRAKQAEAVFKKDGIEAERISLFKEVDFYRRPGDHSKNRAVSYWLVDLPENAILTEDLHENPETGDLVANYTFPKKSFCDKFWEAVHLPPPSEWKFHSKTWEKYKDGTLLKSRIKERIEQKKKEKEKEK
jgi:hypothetical protein